MLSTGELDQLLRDIASAPNPHQLERLFQRGYKLADGGWQGRFRLRGRAKQSKALGAAVAKRGWELVELHPQGARIPRIKIKGRHFEAECMGQRFKSGIWGNGPGYRWCRHDLGEWVQRVNGFRKRGKGSGLAEWVMSGFPHRALRRM